MEFSHSLLGTVALKAVIDDQPLIVEPQAPLIEVLERMSQVRGYRCSLGHDLAEQATPSVGQTSYALISEGDRIIGIFTERDIVKLVAQGVCLESLTIADAMASPVISLAEAEFKDIFAPLFLFRRYRIRHLLIVDDCDRPIGVVSPESIRAVLRPANLLKLRRVSEIMARDVVCADHQSTVLFVAQLMAESRVSCVVITNDDDDRGVLPVGIITERDIVQLKTLQLNLMVIQAGMVMSAPLFLLSPDDSLWTAHQEMQRLRVRRLVVSWNWGKGLGIVTQTSLLRVFDPLEMYGVLETLQATVQQLQGEKKILSSQPPLVSENLPEDLSGKLPEKLSESLSEKAIAPKPGGPLKRLSIASTPSVASSSPLPQSSLPQSSLPQFPEVPPSTILELEECLEQVSLTVRQAQRTLSAADSVYTKSSLIELLKGLHEQTEHLQGVLRSEPQGTAPRKNAL